MSTSAHFKLSDFPHKVLDPIATLTVPPTYATIKHAQRQLMTNAAAIPTLNGGGAHGHMALTLTALAYADISDVPFVIPVAPPANPPPGATQPQITENNRVHQRNTDIYNLYVAVNNALRLLRSTTNVRTKNRKTQCRQYLVNTDWVLLQTTCDTPKRT
jgi:hypothetical protein